MTFQEILFLFYILINRKLFYETQTFFTIFCMMRTHSRKTGGFILIQINKTDSSKGVSAFFSEYDEFLYLLVLLCKKMKMTQDSHELEIHKKK